MKVTINGGIPNRPTIAHVTPGTPFKVRRGDANSPCGFIDDVDYETMLYLIKMEIDDKDGFNWGFNPESGKAYRFTKDTSVTLVDGEVRFMD